jgi:hypothetical protein
VHILPCSFQQQRVHQLVSLSNNNTNDAPRIDHILDKLTDNSRTNHTVVSRRERELNKDVRKATLRDSEDAAGTLSVRLSDCYV